MVSDENTQTCYHDLSSTIGEEGTKESSSSSSLINNNRRSSPDTTTAVIAQQQQQIQLEDDRAVDGSDENTNTIDDGNSNVMSDSRNENSYFYTWLFGCYNNNRKFTDEELLIVAFISFFIFAIIQMIFAIYIAHSHAMIGDSSVMLLDAFTYFFNGCSERYKQQYYNQYQYQIQQQQQASSSCPQQPEEESRNSDMTNDNTVQRTNHNSTHDDANSVVVITDGDDDNRIINEVESEPNDELFLRLRQKIIVLEIIAPSISVVALLMVTILITQQAIYTIRNIEESTTTNTKREEPKLNVILCFSIMNLLLDGVNMYFFTRPNNNMSYCCRKRQRVTHCGGILDDDDIDTTDHDMTDDHNEYYDNNNNNIDITDRCCSNKSIDNIVRSNHISTNSQNKANSDDVIQSLAVTQTPTISENTIKQYHHHHHSHSNHVPTTSMTRTTTSSTITTSLVPTNLNMCSAYTHVLADTLRSLAVITAVLLALYNDIEPALADATAALIVSFLILLSLIPLIQGLYHNMYELYNIRMQLKQAKQNQLEPPISLSSEII